MLDCGATADIALLFRDLPTAITVYVIDSHRPWSLDNLFNNSQVVVFDDGSVEDGESDLREAYEGSLLVPGD